MGLAPPIRDEENSAAPGNHFSCSMTALILGRVREFGGDTAVAQLLRTAGSRRAPEFLLDTANWISYDEAVALWRAGALITHHPQFARAVGEDAAKRLNASPVAALFRSLGSPENVYRQIALSATKYSVVTSLEAVSVGPGFAEIVAVPVAGFPRDPDHCAATVGMLSQPTLLFGLPQATVTHERCAALGARDCHYRVTWETEGVSDPTEEILALRRELAAAQRRLHSIFETAGDLIAADEISDALARITDRAAVEVRAQRHLLAVRIAPDGELHSHHKGFAEDEIADHARRILEEHPAALPDHWLVVPVRSGRRDYGRLLAMYEAGQKFFPQERELLEVYARYAASALDSATALIEAQQRYEQSSALLALARALAVAGTSDEVARKLADAVPEVVDCDRVGVYLWDPAKGELARRATTGRVSEKHGEGEPWSRAPTPGGPLERLLADPRPEPMFVDRRNGDPVLRETLAEIGAVAMIVVPLATADSLLGLLAASVFERPERLEPTADLLDRLSGVAAQATTALQNGRLVDQITHQARHDVLTGLANRLQFTDALRAAVSSAQGSSRGLTLFYLDLDEFKPVNDRFGHDAGDELLVTVGARLTTCTRPSDVVARLGGDEFAILINDQLTALGHDGLSDRLAAAFEQPFKIGGVERKVSVSVGRVEFPADAQTPEELLRLADAAMFASKRKRRASAERE
jgi:diguanylate cyclase (GGDEF)-like protein